MQSTFDERSWLAWLVKARILILTFLLAIQLAVAHLAPASLPLRLFLSTIALWFGLSIFCALLLSFWQEHRLQASVTGPDRPGFRQPDRASDRRLG
jgi:protein-S-isoprenylcysteine O-methyltransferase Ste14